MGVKLKFICTLLVLFTFLYSNFVWAEGFPNHKLSPSGAEIINGLFSKTKPAKMQTGLTQFRSLRPKNLDRGRLFEKLAEHTCNPVDEELLGVYIEVLFVLFEAELKKASIEKEGVENISSADGKIFLLVNGKEYSLVWDDNKVLITE